MKYPAELLEVNTFECPIGRITPERCADNRSKPNPPKPCKYCQEWAAKCAEVHVKRKEWVAKLKKEAEESKEKSIKKSLQCETRGYILTLLEPMLGTVPLNKQLYTDYLASKLLQKEKNLTEEEKKQRIEEELDLVQEIEKATTGFYRDDYGIYIMNYQIKGFLKEAANILKDNIGVRNARSKVDNYVFVAPRRIYIAEAPSGYLERSLCVITPQGPRTCLARSEYVEAGISFYIEITLIKNKDLKFEHIEKLLNYGREKGLGQWRNAGYGAFSWKRAEL